MQVALPITPERVMGVELGSIVLPTGLRKNCVDPVHEARLSSALCYARRPNV
jgi:hypothetical protein